MLHLVAIAREAGVPLGLEDFDRVNARVPVLADLKPGGRFVATDLHAAGGTRLVAKRLIEAGALHADAVTVTGRTIGEEAATGVETPGQQVVTPAERAAENERRPGHPARQPGAGGMRGQALRSRSADIHGAGARVRLGGGGVRRGPGAAASRPAMRS